MKKTKERFDAAWVDQLTADFADATREASIRASRARSFHAKNVGASPRASSSFDFAFNGTGDDPATLAFAEHRVAMLVRHFPEIRRCEIFVGQRSERKKGIQVLAVLSLGAAEIIGVAHLIDADDPHRVREAIVHSLLNAEHKLSAHSVVEPAASAHQVRRYGTQRR
ncbi:hypothetical protein CU669_11490 [Paramagnetospirillum kuznetsovii]|uniref:Uncharacterized protein n=1 Tax=Paramagnetospirillum kuznetsovii TaxID=2053833 RepID=A0A364NXX1_9PROT|nr:hypothetical protein [Paramagnetospirillum kuznetsovii]RAU21916.1 hypothetical protein CU669_11490 [Paramagnetospirillum kuznetsovii]